MRTITKFLAAAFLCAGSFQALSAKDLYVASAANGGSDTNDGLSAATPVAYLSQLNDVIEAGDVIHVKGLIMMSQDPNTTEVRSSGYVQFEPGKDGHQGFYIAGGKWTNITFEGENQATDGFDSEWKGRLFRLNGGGNLTFKNLGFQRGRDLISDGGNGFWIGGNMVVTFIDCTFMNNTVYHADAALPSDNPKSNGRGGAIHKNEVGDLYLYNCTFMANENKEGNAVNFCGGKFAAIGCKFMANTSQINGGEGGALKFWCLTSIPIEAKIEHCLFMGNNSAGYGGAIALHESANRDNAYHDVTIKDCSFVGNKSNAAGALWVNTTVPTNKSFVKVLNSTFLLNSSTVDGGSILVRGASAGSEFTMVNCTVASNFTQGNGGHGAGLTITNDATYPSKNCTKRIYNCIFDGNYGVDGNNNTPSDLSIRMDALTEGEFEAYNSYFGKSTNLAPLDGTAATCTMNYITGNFKEGRNWDTTNAAGMSDDIVSVYAMKNYFAPFIDENAAGLTFGNAQYLTDFGITTDQMGNVRKITGNSCSVGAVELTEAIVDSYPAQNPLRFDPILTGVVNTTEDKVQAEIFVRNGEITVGSGENNASLNLYNMNGSLLKSSTGRMSLNGTNGGFYIVKAVLDNQISVKKIWVK